MKWYKHDTTARHDTKIKLLKKKFGAEGYGVYFQLLEIIGENVKDKNQNEWGFVEEVHKIETLSDEVGVTPKRLKDILIYCNELGLVYKLNGKLCCPKILLRLDEYASRRKDDLDVFQREKELSGQCRDSIGTLSGEYRVLEQIRTDKIRTEEIRLDIQSIGEDVLERIANDYHVPIAFVKSKYEDMINWHKSTGKTRKDWVATLRNFVKGDAIKIKQGGQSGRQSIDARNVK